MPQTHHYLALRHCARSTYESIYLGLGDNYSDSRKDYVAADRPGYGVGRMQCTEQGLELVRATGKWLIESGNIDPGRKIQWEIIADVFQRNIDSANALWEGIQEGLAGLRRKKFVSEHDPEIRIDGRFAGAKHCRAKEISGAEYAAEIQWKLEHTPMPHISLGAALDLLEQVAGRGEVGHLRSYLPLNEVVFDEDEEMIIGAPRLLCDLGADLFLSRAAGADPVFAPNATLSDVFKLYQFHSWYRSVVEVDNSYNAAYGSAQVYSMLQTLRDGYFIKKPQDDVYDTRVTIVLGHDSNLEKMATALGARWTLKSPYISGPNGAFLESPPTSGIHAKRNVDTDRVDLSFVYPNYVADPTSNAFQLNTSGILEYTPLVFVRGFPEYFQSTDHSVFLEPSLYRDGSSPLDRLEEHMRNAMSIFKPYGCFESSADYWSSHREVSGNETVIDEYQLVKETLVDGSHTGNETVADDSETGSPSRNCLSDITLTIGSFLGILIIFSTWFFFRRLRAQYSVVGEDERETCEVIKSRVFDDEGSETLDEFDDDDDGTEPPSII